MAPPSQHDGTERPSDREIHRLVDGDLSPAERAALLETARTGATSVSSTRTKIEALGELRALVRAATADETEPVDADAMWAQIAARIESAEVEERPAGPKRPALRVIEGGLSDKAAREPAVAVRAEEARLVDRAAERSESAPPSLLVRERPVDESDVAMRRREEQVRQRRTIIMIVTGLAAAAAALIAVLGPRGEGPQLATTEPPSTTTSPTVDLALEAQLHQTEVIAVDFGSNVGTVFSVEGSEGSRYAVVWLADEADKGTPDPALDEVTAPEPSPEDAENL